MKNVKIFKGYYRIIYFSFCLTLIVAGVISYLQLKTHIDYEKRQIKRELHNNVSQLEAITGVVHNNLRHFRDNFSYYLEENKFNETNDLLTYIQDYSQENFFHLDSIPQQVNKDEILTISGLGSFENADSGTHLRANLLLNLTPLFSSIQQYTPSTILTYYYSWNENFVAIYPYLSAEQFHINDETFGSAKTVYQQAFPENNPNRTVSWTKAYPDDVGRGLMVSAVIPTFSKNKFEGLFCIDFTLDSLNQMIIQNQYEKGISFLGDYNNELLAHPELVKSSNDSILSIFKALPKEMQSIDFFKLEERQLHSFSHYWLIYENIQDTPWRLIYFVNSWEIYLDILFDIGVSLLFSLLTITLMLTFTAIYTQKRFIKPAGQLIQHIQNESQGSLTHIHQENIPAIWQEWFRIITFIFQRNREMIEELKRSNEILELKVQERTEEIATQNEELLQNQEEILAQRNHVESKNKELEQINEKLTQNELSLKASYLALEERNRQINSSINAALSIQTAMLPYPHRMQKLLKDYFVMYKPKDVVSGDFYWISEVQNHRVLVTADCTGHGVPGALMSMIGNTILDKVISLQQHIHPSEILEEVHKEVSFALKQKDTHNNNGMDMSVLVLEDTEEGLVKAKYAGAKTSFFYKSLEEENIIEVKGSRRSLGGIQNLETAFETKELILTPGTLIYMGSDGYVDQNDKFRKRLGEKAFCNFLKEIAPEPLDQQKALLEDKLAKHMEYTQQRDDILILGFKI